MCWITESEACLDGKIAEEDITVIKILTSELIAPFYFNFAYELNKNGIIPFNVVRILDF